MTLVANELPATELTIRAPQPWQRQQWTEVNPDAEWAARAGLQVVELHNTFFLMGGRTPIDSAVLPVPGASVLWSDVWRSWNGRDWTWSQPVEAFRGMNILTPVAYNDTLFTSAYGGKTIGFKVTQANGSFKVTQSWTHKAQGYMTSCSCAS
jgi:hypothetical protein